MAKLTWLGHASWLLETQGHLLVVDPFLSENPSATASPSDVDAGFVLLTHGHFDHVADAAAIANQNNAMLVANYEIATWFAEKHDVKNTMGMNLGGAVNLPFGRVKMTLAHHSSQLPDGSYGGNPGGFLVEFEGKKVYFAGDTALFGDMQLIADEHPDVAVLPIGDVFTMGPDDSVKAARILGAQTVVPGHYNTWPPIEQDTQAWSDQIRAIGLRPVVPKIGEPIDIA
ncbi:MAG: metal-dependent hydrolase [Aureliella sp.]